MKTILAIFCCAAIASVVSLADEPGAADAMISPLVSDGALQTVREPLARIFQFKIDDSQVKIDREAWEREAKKLPQQLPNAVVNAVPMPPNMQGVPPAMANRLAQQRMAMMGFMAPESSIESLFQQIQEASGSSGRGRGGSGRDMRSDFHGGAISGRLLIKDEVVRLSFEEAKSPQRTLELNVEDGECFRLELFAPAGDMIILHQAKGRQFAVVAIIDGQLFAAKEASIGEFLKRHRQKMVNDIFPLLAKLGVWPYLSPESPEIRKAVLSSLARTAEADKNFDRLIADLDSDRLTVRDKATLALARRFDECSDLIEKKLNDPLTSPEAAGRLKMVLAEHEDLQNIRQTIDLLGLREDAKYVVSLLNDASPEENAKLIAHLERITGEKLGADPAAWKEWAKNRAQ